MSDNKPWGPHGPSSTKSDPQDAALFVLGIAVLVLILSLILGFGTLMKVALVFGLIAGAAALLLKLSDRHESIKVLDNAFDYLRSQAWEHGGGAYEGLGVIDASPVYAKFEHAVLVLGPPRSGKSSAIIIPTVLSSPYGVVATSTKPDVLESTWRSRSLVGPVWSFDPITGRSLVPGIEQVRWSPLRRAADWDSAMMTARAMVEATRQGALDNYHWRERATALLGPLLHAGALDERDMSDVARWVNRRISKEPKGILNDCGAARAVDAVVGIEQTSPKERSSIWSTTAGVLAPYQSEAVCRASEGEPFNPDFLIDSGGTLYLTAPAHQQQLAAPLIVGLLTDVRLTMYERVTEGIQGGVVWALDECANIAPIHDLPAVVSEAGGHNLHVVACFQDLSQARTRWGNDAADGFLTLFREKVILPGIADIRTLEALSTLFGEYDRPTEEVAYTHAPGFFSKREPTVTRGYHTQRERQLSPAEIASPPAGIAILVRGAEWYRLQLTPAHSTPVLQAAISEASQIGSGFEPGHGAVHS